MCSGRSYEEVDFSVLVTSDKVSLSNLEKVGMTKIIWGIGLTVLHIRNTWSVSFLDSLSATMLSSPERCLATMSMGHTKTNASQQVYHYYISLHDPLQQYWSIIFSRQGPQSTDPGIIRMSSLAMMTLLVYSRGHCH